MIEKLTIIPAFGGNGFNLNVVGVYVGIFKSPQEATKAAEDIFAGKLPESWSEEFTALFLTERKRWEKQEAQRQALLQEDLEEAMLLDEEAMERVLEEEDMMDENDYEQALWDSETGAPE